MQEKINNVSKIGVISDSHIPTRAENLPSIIHEHFKNVDLIIHCGDIVNENVLLELGTISPVYAVKGNMDGHDITAPLERIIMINASFILCTAHGTGSPFGIYDRLYNKFKSHNPYMILYGHTHSPDTYRFNDIMFFNPGSCTAGSHYNSIGILDVNTTCIEHKIIPL
jgi:putative phosphoesterase